MRNQENYRKWYAAYRAKNRDVLLSRLKKWQSENKDKALAYQRANQDKFAPLSKKWKTKNKKRVNEYARKYGNHRYATEPEYRLKKLLRRHSTRIKNPNRKRGTSVAYLGCTIAEARAYIERKWLPGMTWENHSIHGWHIDHIVPLVSFDFTDDEQVKIALHYTNLQPLWAKDNLRKGEAIFKRRNPTP